MSHKPPANRLILQYWQDTAPADRLAHLVRDTSRAYARALQNRLNAFDIPFGHWAFLRILWDFDGLTQRELSERAGVMEPTTLVAIRALEARGLVERRQLSGNKKNRYVYLTDAGQALKKQLVPLAEATNQVSQRGIDAADIQTTRRVLLQLLANLADDDAQVSGDD
jgi:DNA-binding MarR family transcriptional regulator